MLEFRLASFEIYENTPMPTTKDEAWRRTNLRQFKFDEVSPSINGDGSN